MLELKMWKTQFTMIIYNHTKIIDIRISRGSPKLWATSTKHVHRLSYYLDYGDYIIFASLSYTQSLPVIFASTSLHVFIYIYTRN
jgi:hypothetical protein